MIELARRVYEAARIAHWEMCTEAVQLARLGEQAELKEQADLIYALKETHKLLDDARKEVGRILAEVERQMCHAYVLKGDGDPVRTQYCTATPDAKQTVKLPPRGSAEYKQLMAHFNVPEDAPFSPDWNKMIDQISADMAAGKPCPKGCDPSKMYVLPKVTIRKKAPVLDGGKAPDVQRPDLLRRLYSILQMLQSAESIDMLSIKSMADQLFAEENAAPEEAEAQKSAAPAFMQASSGEEHAPF